MGRITERSCTHLTDWQIADAFPEECKKYYKIKYLIAKSQIQLFLWNIEEICEEYPDDFLRDFFVEINWMLMPRRHREMYKRLTKIFDIIKIKDKMEKRGRPDLNIDLAKSRQIEDLYSFEKLRANRKYLSALCPFHSEKTPSFYIYPDENKFHCFGCGVHGDAIDFIMKLKGLSFVEAVNSLTGASR